MRLEARKYLTDIQVAAERIARFTVWGVIEIHLAPLRKAVAQLLATP